MSVYVSVLLWLGLCAFLVKCVKVTKTELVCGVEVERYYWLVAFIIFVPLILVAGFRNKVGDTVMYQIALTKLPLDKAEFSQYLSVNQKDIGFTCFSYIYKTLFGDSYVPYFTIIAFIQGLSIITFYRKYSSDYIFSVFLFVASSDYFGWMFNGIRQFLAVSIVLFAVPFLLKKKYVPFILIVIFASTMHLTALMMIPVAFLVQGKAWNKKTILFIILALLAVLFVDQFTSFLDDSLQNTQYKNVVTDFTTSEDDGTNPLRVAFYSLPTIVSFFARKKLNTEENNLINICVNMSILSAGVYLVSMITSGIFLGRLPIYMSLFNYILIPWEIKKIVPEKYTSIVTVGTVLIYLVFYYYQMHFAWGVI